MAETSEQARFRQHLAEMGRAAKGIGIDVSIKARDIEGKIADLPRLAGKDAKYAIYDIEDDLAAMGKSISTGAREVPGKIKNGLETAGGAISSGVTRAANATGTALETAGHKTVEGTRNAFARAAGVRRTPMKEWRHPSDGDAGEDDR